MQLRCSSPLAAGVICARKCLDFSVRRSEIGGRSRIMSSPEVVQLEADIAAETVDRSVAVHSASGQITLYDCQSSFGDADVAQMYSGWETDDKKSKQTTSTEQAVFWYLRRSRPRRRHRASPPFWLFPTLAGKGASYWERYA